MFDLRKRKMQDNNNKNNNNNNFPREFSKSTEGLSADSEPTCNYYSTGKQYYSQFR